MVISMVIDAENRDAHNPPLPAPSAVKSVDGLRPAVTGATGASGVRMIGAAARTDRIYSKEFGTA